MEDEVIFESHRRGEPCEEVKSLGKERIKKAAPAGNPLKLARMVGTGLLKAFCVLGALSTLAHSYSERGEGEKVKNGCSPHRPSFFLE